MRARKISAMLMAGAMVLSLTACGGGTDKTTEAAKTEEPAATEVKTEATTEAKTKEAAEEETDAEGNKIAVAGNQDAEQKLVIWTLSNDLKQFAGHYCENHPDVQIETVVIAPADYPTKVQAAMRGRQAEPDIIVGEPQMLETMYEAGYFEDLNQEPYNAQDYADQEVDYAWQIGQDADGIQRAITYQITPAGVFYRRDIAEKVFGTSDPEEIGKLFADYDTIKTTGQTLKDAGYKIFASEGEMNYWAGDSAWVVDGKLNVDQDRKDYMDLCVYLYQNDMTAYVDAWSTTWYNAMAGEIPVIDADTSVWDDAAMAEAEKSGNTTEVFAYGLPTWGTLVMRDNVKDLSGQWGVCSGPSYGFGGGTYIGISALSENKDLAWDFLKSTTLDADTLNWWVDVSEGDVVSFLPVLEQHKDDENQVYGGEKLYDFFLKQAEGIDTSRITKYDEPLKKAWGEAITAIKTGTMDEESAISNFYDVVESTYPELTVER
ncbi:MAG: ABC transporter substrate-binding protein [Lachnospiraceae bacterium]|nr:ABC transporter substrate-binding protein [Lachnospiraceae bacterium]